MDVKAYAAVKDRTRKESAMRAIKMECEARKLIINLIPNDIDRFEELKVHRYLLVDELNESIFYDVVFDLWRIWEVILSQFEQHDISRASFDPSDNI